jgi:hypothetical protein
MYFINLILLTLVATLFVVATIGIVEMYLKEKR